MSRPEVKAAGGAVAPADATWIGKCLAGRYLIEEQLGAGGAGTVYRARHIGLDRRVAVKLLQRRHHQRWGSRKRFEREAKALAQLSHEHVIAVMDCGVDAEVPFLVMELLDGESLDVRLRRGALDPELALDLTLQILDGLGFVHERGLVHRDIKPGNIFLERRQQGAERVKLLDFGLAKLLAPTTEAAITRTGDVLGTPAYMPPEQVTGEASDARTDVYAAALVAFEMFAGRRPFQGSEPEMLRQQLVDPLPRLSTLKPKIRIDPRIDEILQRATQKEKARRYEDARAMGAALRAIVSAPDAEAGAVASERRRNTARPRRRAADPSVFGRLVRGVAKLVIVLALLSIASAVAVIFLLSGPEGEQHRARLKSVLGVFGVKHAREAEPKLR